MSGNNFYHIKYAGEVIGEDIPALPKAVRKMIQKAIEERIAVNPVHFGKPLRYSLKGHRRIRVSDYRIVYRIDQKTKTVFIVAIKHRNDVYE